MNSSVSHHESVVSNPKINRDSVIIEDWNSDDEEEGYEMQTVRPETQTVKTRDDKSGQTSKKQGIGFKKVKACFVCKSTDHLIKDCNFHDKKSQEPKLKNVVNTGQREGKPVWDNTKRGNLEILLQDHEVVDSELVAKAMDDVSRQAFEEEKRRIASQKKAAQATSTNHVSTDRPLSNTPYVSAASTPTDANASESSFVYLRGKIPIDASTLYLILIYPLIQLCLNIEDALLITLAK
ncbi:hypothetical protein Tco_0365332 [Tanacetum coccineum]